MCAFGALTDWIYGIFSKKTGGLVKIPPKADRVLKYLKYVILAVLLILGAAGTVSVSAMSPWDAFGMLFTVGSVPQFGLVLSGAAAGGILLLLILIGSAFVERFFCRYLCPMGAFFAIASKGKAVVIDKPREGCGKCRICTKNCAMGIPLYETDMVKSGECIACRSASSPVRGRMSVSSRFEKTHRLLPRRPHRSC
jgi:polyferredoxin